MSDLEQRFRFWRSRMPVSGANHLGFWRGPLEAWRDEGDTLAADVSADASPAARRFAWQVRLAQGEALLILVRRWADGIFECLTREHGASCRVESLLERMHEAFPELLPSRADLAADADKPLNRKAGFAFFQGVLLSGLLSAPTVGADILRAMRRPKPTSLEHLERFRRDGALDLGPVFLERRGRVGTVTFTHGAYLNAEDDALLDAFETAVDLVLLDDRIDTGVLRGGPMPHPKYAGRRVFCSGINLTLLCQGRISLNFFIARELGVVSKLYRGLAADPTDEISGVTLEKPWIGVVDGHAIGGGVQLLLVLDHVLAEEEAFFAIPARTEGFIPGVANLRLARLMGAGRARAIVETGHRFGPTDPDGRCLVETVAPRDRLDAAVAAVIDRYSGMGSVGFVANRRAFRFAEEPEDLFRAYMASFCLAQARCLFDPAAADHLAEVWGNRSARKNLR